MNDKKEKEVAFTLMLASSIHDMKNSLSMLMHSCGEMAERLTPEDVEETKRMAFLNYEVSRVNNDLMQLLGIYRLKEQMLPLNIDKHFVFELLEEQLINNSFLLHARGITCEIDCEEDLEGYFDHKLIAGIINNILVNSARYANKKIRLIASQEENYLSLCVEDDGEGFPEKMLVNPEDHMNDIDFNSGSTGLGLYFAAKIAQLHKQGSKSGYIELKNGGSLSGAVFTIFLP